MMSINCSSVNAGLPPLGGMSTPVVLAGSLVGRPTLRNASNCSSFCDGTKSLVVNGLPSPVTPSPDGPWQAEQVPANRSLPLAESPAATDGWVGATVG